MSLETSDGSLHWKATIDDSEFDKDFEEMGRKMQQQLKEQLRVQEQGFQSLKTGAKSVTTSYSDMSGAVAKAMNTVPASVKMALSATQEFGAQTEATTSRLLNAITGTVSAMQTKLQGMQGKALELKSAGLDTSAIEASIGKVQAMVDKLQREELTLKAGTVDTTAMLAALDKVQSEFDQLSRENISLKVGAIDTTSVKAAFAGLNNEIAQLKDAAIELNIKGINEKSLTASLDKINSKMQSLEGITIKADFDKTAFDREYKSILSEIDNLEGKRVQLQAAGLDTASLDATLATLKRELDSFRGATLQIKVGSIDTASVQKALADLKADLSNPLAAAIDLKIKGIDTTSLINALKKVEEQAETLGTISMSATLNTADFQKEYIKLESDLRKLETERLRIKADGVDTSALDSSLQKIRDRMQELGTLPQGAISAQNVFKALTSDTAELGDALSALSFIAAKGAGLDALQTEAQQTGAAFTKVIGQAKDLKAAVAGVGGGVLRFSTTGIDEAFAQFSKVKDLPAVEVPVTFSLGSISEMNSKLEGLKQKYSELSAIDRNSDIGKGMLQNINEIEGELADINKGFQAIARNAAGSLDEKIAQVARLKAEYSALSEVERKSTVGQNLAKNIQGMDKEIAKINNQFSQTESIVSKAAVAIGSYFTFQAATTFVSDLIRVRGEFQRLEAVLTNSIGADAAAKALGELQQYAATSPAQLNELTSAYIKLTNMGLQPTMDEMRAFGDISASTGKSFDQLAEAIIDAQTGEFERLKEFGIRAEKSGDQVQFAFKGVKTQVDFTSTAIKDYIVGLGKLEGVQGATAAIAGTLEGQISNLKDAWEGMLNEVGQGSEGVFTSAISGLKFLVDNYETVVDILKVLVLTYGSYKAAVIASSLVTVQYSVATKGVSVAMTLQATATTIAQRAMLLLNTAMRANPAGLILGAVTALASAFIIFGKEAKGAATAQQLLADAQKDMSSSLSETEAKIRPYIEALKDANVSEADRVRIYNELKAIDPKIVEGLTAKTLSYKTLTENVNTYLASLRQQYALEANEKALQGSINEEIKLQKRIEAAKKQIEFDKKLIAQQKNYDNQTAREARARIARNERIAKESAEALKRQNKVSKELANAGKPPAGTDKPEEPVKKTVEYYDKLIAAKKKERDETSENSAAYKKFSAEIADLERQREAITGKSTSAAKAENAAIEKGNDLLDKRKDILQQISDLEGEARQSGLLEDPKQKQVDAINEKYDKAIKGIDEYNKKVAEFNKKNGKSVAGIGTEDINRLNTARTTELRNADLKADAELYLKHLEEQKALFQRYEDAKKTIGVDAAKEMFGEQAKGFTSYLDYLNSEAQKLAPKLVFGIANIGDLEKMKGLTDEISETQKAAEKARFDQQVKDMERVFQATASYNQKRRLLDTQYEKDLALIREKFRGKEQKQQEANLNERYRAEREALDDSVVYESQVYRKLNESMLRMTRQQVKSRMDEIKKVLQSGKIETVEGVQPITPQMRKDLEGALDGITEFYNSTGEVFGISQRELGKVIDQAGKLSDTLSGLAEIMRPFNNSLANTLQQMAQMADMAGVLAKGAAAAASGDYAGAALAGMEAVGSISKIFAEAKQSADSARQAVQDFYQAIQFGEISTAIAMRQRMQQEAEMKVLTLERLAAEKKALEENKKASQEQYNLLLKQLQQEQYISAESTKKGKGNLMFGLVGYLTGLGGKTKVEQELKSLAGMTFDQIEKLFNNGQLTDSARALFEQLQKLKQEGVDIDSQLQELRREAQQVFTGTTADEISSMIRNGFADGLRSVQQFGDKTEDIIRNALLNGLEYGFIQKQVQKLYEQLATDAEDGGGLDKEEIRDFYKGINKTIEDAAKIVEQIEKETGVALSKAQSEAAGNSLAGAIKTQITEDTGQLVAAQMGGMRLTLIEGLNVAKQGLIYHQQTAANTANAVLELRKLVSKFDAYETGAKKINTKL